MRDTTPPYMCSTTSERSVGQPSKMVFSSNTALLPYRRSWYSMTRMLSSFHALGVEELLELAHHGRVRRLGDAGARDQVADGDDDANLNPPMPMAMMEKPCSSAVAPRCPRTTVVMVVKDQ